MNHIFEDAGHGLAELVEVFGGKQDLVKAVAGSVASLEKIPTNAKGVFDVFVSVGGQVVQVRGRVMNGTIHIGDFWVPAAK